RDVTLRERFVREGEAAARIRHPHVVDVTDVGTHHGTPFLVMEYLEGEDLAACLDRDGVLSVQQTADVMVPVLAAASAAHDAGVIHRDLKPANIFLERALDGGVHPKVVDFGISKVDAPGVRRRTADGVLLGTLEYMAPEQVLEGREVDARADQYA